MIIIGTTELKFTKATGSFHCPACQQDRVFRHRVRRQFLTLYFIPLIPLGSLGEFVECTTCRGAFDVAVSRMTATQQREAKRREAHEWMRRVLVLIVAADDQVTPEELETVREFAERHDQPEVTAEQILREAAVVRQTDLDTMAYIRHAARHLSEEHREELVSCAFLTATAGGELSPARESLLTQLPDAVGVPEPRFRELIARAADA